MFTSSYLMSHNVAWQSERWTGIKFSLTLINILMYLQKITHRKQPIHLILCIAGKADALHVIESYTFQHCVQRNEQ